MNVPELFRRAVEGLDARVQAIGEEDWERPTPCTDWNVRALVNHVVAEDRWAPPLLDGATIADVGDRFDGDVLGDDPKGAWKSAANDAVSAVEAEGAMETTTHLSFGDLPGGEYTMQLFADHLIHGWDLARAIGGDERLDAGLVDACAAWFPRWEEGYRRGGAIAARVEVAGDADAQTRLLARFGRRA